MNSAIDLAKDIYRKIKAREKSKSEKCRTDYAKSITRDYKELSYYCKCMNINVDDVWEQAVIKCSIT